MSLVKRISNIFKAKANDIVEKMEDPEDTLNYSLVEMRENLSKIKKSMLDVATLKKKLENELSDINIKISEYEKNAELALESGREDLAKASIQNKNDLIEKKTNLESQIKSIEEQLKNIEKSKEQMEDNLIKLQSKKEELITMKKVSDAQVMIKETLTGIANDTTDLGERIRNAEEKIKEKYAKSQAIDYMVDAGMLDNILDDEDKVEKELKEIEKQKRAEEEFEELKKRVAAKNQAIKE
ncbi:PspA/IM30 family protein [Thermoanaerobacterium thermosaccharolyticum]|uniref:PspA/IM30 family protein n=1 Tax=Thermoanaerobacterium thermosaccharolyticum TaxID=1517 RepID=UPI00123ADA6D|nr:PspA/IM30 family protein [Thermoanaerobacterium thermosaccharolyticum]KAA5808379.1 PspA/IM30 family protein [Thermoanaerobacterium thermosaccharolyticum]MBE0067649.1 PspA/IM30 family protein [Thermoanaerobacterium thermosaccharolyticum]MBE0227232.1 PspA/IM30 family protein [Thermoanaerobacterium thermosaccharolyticum]